MQTLESIRIIDKDLAIHSECDQLQLLIEEINPKNFITRRH